MRTSSLTFSKFQNNDNIIILKRHEFVKDQCFENAALIYSVSESASVGGKLGWVKESSLNKIVIQSLSNLKINEITKPIFTMNRYIILKIDDIKFKEIKYDKDKELKNLIKFKTNEQLNQYSNIYFNKVKKNTKIHEF